MPKITPFEVWGVTTDEKEHSLLRLGVRAGSEGRGWGHSDDLDGEGAAWDVFLAPAHNEDVLPLLFHCVVDCVLVVADELDRQFIHRGLGALHAHVQDVVAWNQQSKVHDGYVPPCCLLYKVHHRSEHRR